MQFDVLIKGGEVVAPGQCGRLDVAIKRGRIAAVDRDIPAETAWQVIDARGQYVTPGLVDLHTHVYHSVTYWGIHADPIASRSGVTTWIDVGSAGAYNLVGLRDFIVKPAKVRIQAMLNISGLGLTAPTGELRNLNYCDVEMCCKLVNLNHDLVCGIKARIDEATVGDNSLEPLRRAREAAERCEIPMMVHIGVAPPEIADVLELLRPGDILTHCFTGHTMKIVDDEGRLLESAKRAWDAGVIMDTGHGGGSFSFETAEVLMSAGYKPDVISSDMHQMSVHGPMFDLPTCLSKFMMLGMSFQEVIEAATVKAASAVGLQNEAGTLKPGVQADVALFKIEQGNFPFYDVFMNRRDGRELIRNTLTLVNGVPLLPVSNDPPAPWIELTEEQRWLIQQGHTPTAWGKSGMDQG
ncbi:MAG TPA: amidohydrolase/deacetylase family metallohydrolase [Phototrophicaceae bacterium]|jgi:dihydroorotase|nr:amidohydrolase/deacetylase family metallohydrolase [Phototrophicaceae bacterium]